MDYTNHFNSVLEREANALLNLKETMNYNEMNKIVDLLVNVRERKCKVITSGCGTSGTAARRIAHTLSCTETPALFLSPSDASHGGMGVIQRNDIVILLSKGGNTREVIDFLECCKQKEAIIIGVTADVDSKLGKASDHLLVIDSGDEPCRWGIMPCCSTLAAIAVFDAIALSVMRYNRFTPEEFLRIHPNGLTAERLNRIINEHSGRSQFETEPSRKEG